MARSWLAQVHDIVRGEFKDCRSWKDTKNHCIVIKHVDVAEDEKVRARVPVYVKQFCLSSMTSLVTTVGRSYRKSEKTG